jgi:hypothetical protein
MPYPWIPPRGKQEKKAVFSPHCGDETTTYYNRANEKPRYDRGFSQREVYMITTSLVLLFVVLVAFMFFLNR